MDLHEYLRLVANRIEKADEAETIRLITLLMDTLKEVLEKHGKQVNSVQDENENSR